MKLTSELSALETRLVQEQFPEYEQMRKDATGLEQVIAELHAKRMAAERKQELAVSAAAIERDARRMRELELRDQEVTAKKRRASAKWLRPVRDKVVLDTPASKLDKNLKELAQALSTLQHNYHQLKSRQSSTRRDIDRFLDLSGEYRQLLVNLSAARETLSTSLVEDGLLPLHLRPQLSKRLEAQSRAFHGMLLRVPTAPGLAHLSDKQFDVTTRSGDALTGLMESLQGGSIGLSGPRGAGKTTLLRMMAEPGRVFRQQRAVVSQVIPAPVEYEAKEFVLHLFQRVCTNVLDAASPAVAPEPEQVRRDTSEFHHVLIARTATALLVMGLAGWIASVLLNRPPNAANLALATVLGALLTLTPTRFLRWRRRSDTIVAALYLGITLVWWSAASLSLPSSGANPLWLSASYLVTLLGLTLLMFMLRRGRPIRFGVLMTITLVGTAALQMAATHSGVQKTLVVVAAGVLTWIYVNAAFPQHQGWYWYSSVRGVLLAGGVLSLVFAVQLGQSPAGFAWLVWGSGLAMLATLLETYRLGGPLYVAALMLAVVPLGFGGIGTNWPFAIAGLVSLFIGFAAKLYEASPLALPRTANRFASLATSDVVRHLTGHSRVVLLLAGTVLITAAGVQTRLGVFAVVSALVVLIMSHLRGGTNDFSEQKEEPVADFTPSPHENWADGLAAEAKQHIEEIRFQQTISATWQRALKLSGGSGFSVGLDSTSGGSRARQTIARTYPEIVEALRAFLTKVCAHGPAVIAIDEIDKLSPEAAGKFLNDIKAIFGVPGCFYLVSLSEDAMASFERRGMPIRDVFESSFDDVVHVDHLTFEESRTMLTARVAGLPLALLGVCYVVAGGIPREVIRIARRVFSVVEQNKEQRIDEIAKLLTNVELAERTRGTEMSVTGLDTETASAVLKVLDTCRRPLIPRTGAPVQCPLPPTHSLLRTLTALITYNFLLSTLVDFLTTAGEDHIRTASGEPGRRHFERLARARRLISVESSLAWAEIAKFRYSWKLPMIDYPIRFAANTDVTTSDDSS
ncbi:hypothetical protein [Lentzea pudingi]|uniref:hypothetical protein n=1 Tax=Lentzea pudingi TaxID=1789439 RepID=UPI00166C59AC|nr:hypothetical protein [Lentzea pudingi]